MGRFDKINDGIAKMELAMTQQATEYSEPEEEHEEPDLCAAVEGISSSVAAMSAEQAKAIASQQFATDKGIQAALKAHAKVVQLAIGELSQSPDTAIETVLAQVAESNTMIANAIREIQRVEAVEPGEYRFDIERDGNGYLQSVIARPV